MSPSQTPPQPTSEGLNALLARCRALCEGAQSTLTGVPAAKQEFLTSNLQDALRGLELILRVLDKESGREDEPQGFLSRLTRGIGRREPTEGETGADHLPDLDISHHGLQGNSWTIPLTELIGFLAYGRKTGVLWVDSPDENFLLGLEDGRLMHATSDRTPEGVRLGEVLVGQGFLTRRQLERFLDSRRARGEQDDKELSGAVLLSSGMINEEELQAALVHQVQQLFLRLIDTRDAIFRFREGMQVALAYQVDLNIPKLLLESARVQDELSSGGQLRAIVGELASHVPEDGVPEDWDSWNQEMLGELQRMVAAEATEEEPSEDDDSDQPESRD